MAPSEINIPEYCRIHAKRMEAEGFTKTALVLEWAATEIERLKASKQMERAMDEAMTLQEKLAAHSKPDQTGCILWTGLLNYKGYGRLEWNGKSLRAHRAAYEISKGKIPRGLCVCHRCDVRHCVNPAHLWLGTSAENIADRDNKQRQARGIRPTNAKLTDAQVLEIRSAAGSHRALGRKYGVNHMTVGGIKRREIYLMNAAMGPRKDPPHPMFANHNCAWCASGKKPCKQGNPSQCEFPHARND